MHATSTLDTQLALLYGQAIARQLPDLPQPAAWSDLVNRAKEDNLEAADWRIVHSLLNQVIRHDGSQTAFWVQRLSLRFGTASHSLDNTWAHADAMGGFFKAADEHLATTVDPLAYGAFVAVNQLPPPVNPIHNGLAHYLKIEPALRTHFLDGMFITEQALAALGELSPADAAGIQPRLRDLWPEIKIFLEGFITDLEDLMFDHNSLPLLMYYRIVNALYEGKQSISMSRLHINMITLNELDPTNELGNIYLRVVRQWLQENFGNLHVVQSPQRTTFDFEAGSVSELRGARGSYVRAIRGRLIGEIHKHYSDEDPRKAKFLKVLSIFKPKATISTMAITPDRLMGLAIKEKIDLTTFGPVVEFVTGVPLAELNAMSVNEALSLVTTRTIDFKKIHKSNDTVLRRTLDALIIKATLEFMGQLTAQTTFFEKNQGQLAESAVYSPKDRPLDVELGQTYDRMLKERTGFVGPGQYDPTVANFMLKQLPHTPELLPGLRFDPDFDPFERDDETLDREVWRYLQIIPNLSRIKGAITHDRPDSKGGLLEQLETAINRLATAKPDEVVVSSSAVNQQAAELLKALRLFYSRAVTDPRYLLAVRKNQVFAAAHGIEKDLVASNFFLQDIALEQNTHLGAMEFDSFGAYQAAYPQADDIDTKYHVVLDALFTASKKMGCKMPIVSKVAGDHVEFSFPSTNLKGERIQPQQFATQVQIAVKTHFQKQEFQDNHKVDIYESEIIFENSGDIVFLRPGILEEMRISMGWNTTPLLGEKIPGGIKLLYPRKDGQGKDGQASPQSVSHEDVSAYLANAGIPNRIISSSKQTKRFKMWQPQGSGNIRGDELVFSMNEPAGYEPFRRSLTVSVVVGDHNPIRTLQDVEEFLRLKGDLSESLSQIKHDSWPHKQAMMILPKDKKHGRPVSSPSHGEVRLGGRYRGTSGVIGTFDTSAPITTSLPTIRPKAQLAGGSASHLRTADGTLVAPKIKLTPGVIPIQNQIRKPKFFATFATSRSPFTGAGRTALFLKTPLSRPVFR